jgi:hypothetical protein
MISQDLLVSPERLYNNFKIMIDEYRQNINTKDTYYYKYLLEQLRNTKFWNIYCSSEKVCMHIYKNGNKAGEICGSKVFIKTENKLQRFLCSRHCRDYNSKKRSYNSVNKRCNHMRNNGEQCRHKCNHNKEYCYIHKKLYNELIINANDKNDINVKSNAIKNLEKRRNLYNLKKYDKIKYNKHKYINNIIKYNDFQDFLKFSNSYKLSKIFNQYNNFIFYYYNKTKHK